MKANSVLELGRSVPQALGAALLLGALATSPAAAQTLARPGFWMDAGIGYGRLRLTCTTCASIVAKIGPAYTVSVGGAASQNVLLGVQGELWQSSGAPPRQQVQTVTAIVQWYPWPAAKFWVRGGVGIVRGSVALKTDTTSGSAKGTGIALTISAGYDFRLTPHFALALQAATNIAALGDLAVGGATANDVIAYVSRIGIALVWR